MRFILEHPWISSLSIMVFAVGLLWSGLQGGQQWRIKVGLFIGFLSLLACTLGLVFDTPTEHAKRLVDALVRAVEHNDPIGARLLVSDDVLMVDSWKGMPNKGVESVEASIQLLHEKHELQFNTILRFQPIERLDDVLVELSLLSRVSGIGTVPSRWRILVTPTEDGIWKIYSIDAIEIMGRSYR